MNESTFGICDSFEQLMVLVISLKDDELVTDLIEVVFVEDEVSGSFSERDTESNKKAAASVSDGDLELRGDHDAALAELSSRMPNGPSKKSRGRPNSVK